MYPFVKHAAWDRPDELIKIIQRWRERGTKLKLLITQTPVNLDVYIKNFGFTAKGGMGDYFALKSRRHFCRRRENFVMKIRLAKAGFFVAGGAKELACKIQLKIACVEVTRGKIQKLSVTETNKDFYLDIEAADEAGELRHGQDNFYFTDGHTSSAILKEILSKWSVPAEIHVSDVKHGKKVYRKKYLCDMIADVLKDIKEQGGGEYFVRATGTWLDYCAADNGLERREATHAYGNVIVTADPFLKLSKKRRFPKRAKSQSALNRFWRAKSATFAPTQSAS